METLSKIMNSKIALLIVAMLCAMGFAHQELLLGSDKINVIVFALIFGLVAGSAVELVRSKLLFQSKFNLYNILAWVIGSILGTLIMFIP